MTSIQFPHIHRKFTAAALLLFFAGVSILNLCQNELFNPTTEKKLRFAVMQNPRSSPLHEKLGEYYFMINPEAAKREYTLAQENSVLGAQSSPWQNWLNLEKEANDPLNQSQYWEKVAGIYPDYTYAYIKLAAINLEMGNTAKANAYLQEIRKIDQTNQITKEISGKLK